MKFEKQLRLEVVPEWRLKYIDYKGLKSKLRYIQQAIVSKEENEKELEQNNDYDSQSYKRFSYQSQNQRTFSMTSLASSFFHKVSSALVTIQKQQNLQNLSVPKPKITSLDNLFEQVEPEERLFFMALDKELVKIETFYESKEKEASARMKMLTQQYEMLREEKKKQRISRSEPRKSKIFVKQGLDYLTSSERPDKRASGSTGQFDYKTARKRIKKALFEFYRGVEILRKYCVLNFTGFNKILKKYDKISGRNGSKIYMEKVKKCYFVKSNVAKDLLKETEDFYGKHFESGSRSKAMQKLRMPNKENKTYYSPILRVGFYLGLALPVLVNSLQKAHEHPFTYWLNLLQLYTGFILPLCLLLLMGVNMLGWTKARINYKFIFELDPRDNLDFRQFFELPAIIFLVMSYFMLFSFLDDTDYIKPRSFPIFFAAFAGIIILNPFPILYYNARKWFVLSIARLFGSGLLRVEFRDFFIADGLTSLSYSLIMLQLFGCHGICDASISTWTPFLGSLPPFFRLLQCLKRYRDTHQTHHFINLCKYGIIITSIFMASWYHKVLNSHRSSTISFSLWLLIQSVTSLYTFSWDVKMDWSLFKLQSVNYLLRDELGYRYHWIYYYVIISNFFLRWSWVLAAIRPHDAFVGFFIAFGEVIRRWQWNFVRVEYEHVNNCEQNRAIKEISLPFQTQIVDLMSPDEFGVTIAPDDHDHTEESDYDRTSSFSSWRAWKRKMFTNQPAHKHKANSADSLKDFEPRNDIPEYAYDDIYEESDDDSLDENDVDDDDIYNSKKRSTRGVSLIRAEGPYGLSNAYASRSFLPIDDRDGDS